MVEYSQAGQSRLRKGVSNVADARTENQPSLPRRPIFASDLERRLVELDVLRWLGQALNFSLALDDLLELIYAQTSRVIETTTFTVAQVHPERGSLSLDFHVEHNERLYPTEEWPLEAGLAGQIVRTGLPIRTDDYMAECARRGLDPTPEGAHARAWMGAPLSAQDRVIGVMIVSSPRTDIRYTEDQQQLFSAIADQAAAMLDKARLYREMERHARELSAINEVSSLITSTLNLRKALALIMDKSVELLGAEAGSLVLVDEATGELVFEMTAGPASANLAGVRLPPGTGIVGAVAREGRPILIRDAQRDDRWYRGLDDSTTFVTRSLIAVPMISRGQVIGVIELLNRRDGSPFDADDERLLGAFAANAAIAIENARLFTRTDQALAARVEELSMLQRINRELNATLDYNKVMDLTLEWALRTTGADAGLVAVAAQDDSGQTELRFLAQRGYPESAFAAAEVQHWPLSRGIIGRAMRSGKAELVTDVSTDPDYVALVPDMAAQLTVPIWREERRVGVIALEARHAGRLDQEALEFVTRLADHAAIAMDNARLFEELQRANLAKSEFVSFVSHELKQPMTAIRGYVDLLARGMAGELSETQRTFLETVRANVDRMATLVSDLLDLSRIESGRLRLTMRDVSLPEVVYGVARALEGQLAANRHRLALELAPDLPAVHADADRLAQILTNLISNADKYTPDDGVITIRARRTRSMLPEAEADDGTAGEFVLCSVTDTGIGMSPDDQLRLFTKYFRANDPAVRAVPGTGLGLVITKSLVELHGGAMGVTSAPGQGSTFCFTIPAAGAASTP